MVENSAKIVYRRRKRRSKNGGGKIFFFFKRLFLPVRHLFFELFLLVSSVHLFEVYCKKTKKSKKKFSVTKNVGVRCSGYTYRGGYTYRAGCTCLKFRKSYTPPAARIRVNLSSLFSLSFRLLQSMLSFDSSKVWKSQTSRVAQVITDMPREKEKLPKLITKTLTLLYLGSPATYFAWVRK